MSSVLVRKEEIDPFLLVANWEKGVGFVLTEYEKYGDSYNEVSRIVYPSESKVRLAFSAKLYRLKRFICDGPWIVFNVTDGVIASPDSFRSRSSAEVFANNFRKRFKRQGYYFTSRMERIPISGLKLKVVREKDVGKMLR